IYTALPYTPLFRYGGDRLAVGVGPGGLQLRAQLALRDDSRQHGLEAVLDERDLSRIDGVHARLLDVDADHGLARLGKDGCGGQADVAEADDADRIEGDVGAHQWTPGGSRGNGAGADATVACPGGVRISASAGCHLHNKPCIGVQKVSPE